MEQNPLVALIGHIAWPITIAIVIILFRKQIGELCHNVTNIKIGEISVKIDHMADQLESVEEATKNLSIDLYKVTGDALNVREEIWGYVAEIIRKASPNTKYEMSVELNKYHLSRLGVRASEVKQMLYSLGYFNSEVADSFNDEVTQEFVQAVFDFQDAQQLDYSDGVVGPSSLAMLKRNVADMKIAQQTHQR